MRASLGIAGLMLALAGPAGAQSENVKAAAALLTSPQSMSQSFIMDQLDRLNVEERKELAPLLGSALRNPSMLVRANAGNALKLLGPSAASTIPQLLEGLRIEREGTMIATVYTTALASIGTEAVPALLQAKKDKDHQKSVLRVLGKMGPTAKEAIPAITKDLKSSDLDVRFEAARALTRVDLSSREVTIPVLLGLLKSSKGPRRSSVAETLGEIGPEASSALPELLKIVNDPATNTTVSQALIRIGPKDPVVVNALIDSLKDAPCQTANYGSAVALSRLGNGVIDDLEAAAKTENGILRQNLIFVLEKINTPEAENVLQKLYKGATP